MNQGDVGSADFQSNPIYGDQPQSYGNSTYDDNQSALNDNNHENSPFAANQQEQQQQQPPPPSYGNDTQPQQQQYNQQQYGNDGSNQQQPPHAPPPYNEEPPAAYTGNGNIQNDEPEDVVAGLAQDEDVGDYGITQPKTEDTDTEQENGEGLFGNFFIRTVVMASAFIWVSILSMALWFMSVGGGAAGTGWGFSAFAIFVIFLAALMSLVFAILKKFGRPIPAENILFWGIIGCYVLGGVLYFCAGCAVAYAFNEGGSSYIAGIFFAEQSFVGFHAVLAGVDLWKRQILNNKKWRVLIYNVLFFLVSLVCFFAYAVTSTEFDKVGLDNAGPAFLALFYFLIMIPQVLFVIIYLIPALQEKLGKPIVFLILAGAFYICLVCVLVGYFILTGGFLTLGGNAYFIGIGFFVLITGTVISFDMLFDRFIPGYKDGGSSVSDQEARGVPTTNPDSD